ncbi:MAG: bifunctional DNA primase/polymerase [Fimbriimonadaceae bacterium]|nr:bifunctional DNA primase/polymerase [Fimbriimonadaceae bacterium]
MPPGDNRDAKGPGAFAISASALRRLGLFALPCGGSDGKTPLVKGFNTWHRLLSEKACLRFIGKWPHANIAVITGQSNLAVVDVDSNDASLLTRMERRFGYTPLVTRTGSGNFHLWYYNPHGVEPKNLRTSEGIPVEIKAGKTIVVVPPSINFATGRAYEFVRGGWDDVLALPLFPGLEPDRPKQSDVVLEGRRNDTAFSEGLVLAGRSGSLEELQEGLERWNRDHAKPPLEAAEVAGIARSAWNY